MVDLAEWTEATAARLNAPHNAAVAGALEVMVDRLGYKGADHVLDDESIDPRVRDLLVRGGSTEAILRAAGITEGDGPVPLVAAAELADENDTPAVKKAAPRKKAAAKKTPAKKKAAPAKAAAKSTPAKTAAPTIPPLSA